MIRRDFMKGVSAAIVLTALGIDITPEAPEKGFLLFYISTKPCDLPEEHGIPTIELSLESLPTTNKRWKEDVARIEEKELRYRKEHLLSGGPDIWLIPLDKQLSQQGII